MNTMNDRQPVTSGGDGDQAIVPTIWVVIVSWNTLECLDGCLRDLQAQTYPSVRTIVVDNGSDDGTVPAVRSRFPDVFVVPLKDNSGFARAVNLGVEQALSQGADYILLLNPDTHFDPNLLTRLEAVMRNQPRLAVTSPKIYLARDPHRLWGVGGTIGPAGPRIVGLEEVETGAYDAVQLDFVLGCAMFVRAQVWRQIGLMDHRFFAFYEEIDFCLRAQAAGWEVKLAADIHMRHTGGATAKNEPGLRTFHLGRSRMVFLCKYFDRFQWLPLVRSELHHFVRTLRWVLRGPYPLSVIGFLRGTLSGLTRRT